MYDGDCPCVGPPPGASITTGTTFSPDAGPANSILLYAEQFADPSHRATTAALVVNGTMISNATWRVSNANVSTTDPNNSFVPSPAPGGVTVVGETPGAATLTGTDPASGLSASIPIDYYPSIDFGCDFRATPAQSFGGSSVPVTSPLTDSDIYETGPSTQALDPCTGTVLATGAGTAYVWHFPFGATIVTDGNESSFPIPAIAQRTGFFPTIPASAWTNAFTSIPAATLSATVSPCATATGPEACLETGASVVLFKTRGGAIVKFDIKEMINNGAAIGPYEVSDAAGTAFPY